MKIENGDENELFERQFHIRRGWDYTLYDSYEREAVQQSPECTRERERESARDTEREKKKQEYWRDREWGSIIHS